MIALDAGRGALREQALAEIKPFLRLAEPMTQLLDLTPKLEDLVEHVGVAATRLRLNPAGHGLTDRALKDPNQTPGQESRCDKTGQHPNQRDDRIRTQGTLDFCNSFGEQ